MRWFADRGQGEQGTASLILPMVLWVATLVAIVIIDIGAYLVAAARAQSLADAAALAAVSADAPTSTGQIPYTEAERVTRAGDGQLVECRCLPGRERATVTVSVPVPGLVIPTLGASRVTAEAAAVLAPPDELAPGPTRERARWPIPLDGG
ncbi:MAG: hypothetical protein EA388_01875 [Nitriliruptor sp.]|nr:MAG: hypothetical protein EA388_01875 [Nitriliruptor sp.]